jgi:hypothetical protein
VVGALMVMGVTTVVTVVVGCVGELLHPASATVAASTTRTRRTRTFMQITPRTELLGLWL